MMKKPLIKTDSMKIDRNAELTLTKAQTAEIERMIRCDVQKNSDSQCATVSLIAARTMK